MEAENGEYHLEGGSKAQQFLSNRLAEMTEPMSVCEALGLAYILGLMAAATLAATTIRC